MKLKTGFMLCPVGDENIVVPINERTNDFHGMIRLNKSAAYLWENMQSEFTKESLVAQLLEKYEVTEEIAAKTVDRFVESLLDGRIIEQ